MILLLLLLVVVVVVVVTLLNAVSLRSLCRGKTLESERQGGGWLPAAPAAAHVHHPGQRLFVASLSSLVVAAPCILICLCLCAWFGDC